MLQHRLDFGPDHAGSRELLVFASKRLCFVVFPCWNVSLARGFFWKFNSHARRGSFFQCFFVRFWVWGSWFSRTALLGLQKALFYKVSILKCYYGSRNRRIVLSIVLPCEAGIVFSVQLLPFWFRIDFRIDQGFDQKRYRKRCRRGIETGKSKLRNSSLLGSDWGDGARGQY